MLWRCQKSLLPRKIRTAVPRLSIPYLLIVQIDASWHAAACSHRAEVTTSSVEQKTRQPFLSGHVVLWPLSFLALGTLQEAALLLNVAC